MGETGQSGGNPKGVWYLRQHRQLFRFANTAQRRGEYQQCQQ